MNTLLWRVRNRLLVTYSLVGILPFALVLLLSAVGITALISATASYLTQSELDDRLDRLAAHTREIADDLLEARRTDAGATILTGDQIPSWSRPGFKGVVYTTSPSYLLAAHAEAGSGDRRIDVFASVPLDDALLAQLLPGLGSTQILNIEPASEVDTDDLDSFAVVDSSRAAPLPMRFWDRFAYGSWPLQVTWMDSGRSGYHFFFQKPRPGLIVSRLLSPLGVFTASVILPLLTIAGAFMFVHIIAIASSVRLTRTITSTVHQLHTGTKKIESGDFSHRIPVVAKDQLGDLAGSFNSMTERIEQLIVEVKKKEKLESELEIARRVQAQLFPRSIPDLKTLELAGLCQPARVVSGDYYDFIPVDNNSTAITIGDISGKGISAALLMASVQASLHAQLSLVRSGGRPADLVARLNQQLYLNTPPEKYATFFLADYDNESRPLCYTNAGHLAPILVRGKNVVRLDSNGSVVGLLPDMSYAESVVLLEPGDVLAAFTDGITESEDGSGEQFGEHRLAELLVEHANEPLEDILKIVAAAVRRWAADPDDQDDTTLVLARCR